MANTTRNSGGLRGPKGDRGPVGLDGDVGPSGDNGIAETFSVGSVSHEYRDIDRINHIANSGFKSLDTKPWFNYEYNSPAGTKTVVDNAGLPNSVRLSAFRMQYAIELKPNTQYTLSLYAKSLLSNPTILRMQTLNTYNPSTSSNTTSQQRYYEVGSTLDRKTFEFRTGAGAYGSSYVPVTLDIGNLNNDVLELERVMLNEGTTAQEYFDGNTPGAYWLNKETNGKSVTLGPKSVEVVQDGLDINFNFKTFDQPPAVSAESLYDGRRINIPNANNPSWSPDRRFLQLRYGSGIRYYSYTTSIAPGFPSNGEPMWQIMNSLYQFGYVPIGGGILELSSLNGQIVRRIEFVTDYLVRYTITYSGAYAGLPTEINDFAQVDSNLNAIKW